METTTTPQTNAVATTAKWYTNPENLLKVFQATLGISTLFYVAGYLSWAAFAYHNGLGFLPALREQYVIAGIVPVLLAVMSISLVTATIKTAPLFKLGAAISFNTVRVIGLSSLIPFFLVQYLGSKGIISNEAKEIGIGIIAYLAMSISLVVFLNIKQNKEDEYLHHERKFQLIFSLVVVMTLFCVILLNLYIKTYFPRLPREFGGPKAEPFVFDVDRTELSKRTLSIIGGADLKADTTTQKVCSTDTLYLIFDSEDYLLLKKHNADLSKNNPLIKLKTSCVRAQFPLR